MHGCEPRGRRTAIATAIGVSLLALAAAAGAATTPSSGPIAASDGAEVVPGEVIVAYRPGTTAGERSAALASVAAAPGRDLLFARAQVVEVEPGEETEAAAALERDPRVRYAEPNGIVRAASTPNDPRFAEQWSLANGGGTVAGATAVADADIDAPEGWDTSRGVSNAPPVAVVDTGVAIDHPEFEPASFANPGESGAGRETNGVDDDDNGLIDDYRGWDFIWNDNDPVDDYGHGTYVAAVIAARASNRTGIAGAAAFPRSGPWAGPPILPVKVLNRNGTGSFESIAAGLAYAGSLGVPVVNASVGGDGTSQVIDDAIASHPETLYVIAAGNDSSTIDATPHTPCVPAHLPDAPNKLCVASTDPADELAASSNHGPVNVDLAAPGVSVLSAWPETSVFSDDFEHPIARLWKTNDPGQAGAPRWGASTLYSASPTQSITDSPGGTIFDPVPYAPDQDNWARTRNPIELGGGHDCRVEASVYVDAQFNVDALSWEATRTPDESSSWQRFANWTGTFTERIPAGLPEELAAGQPVYLRLRMRSDASVQDDGAYVDDLAVVCWGTYNASSYEVHSGTSVAAPHVAGAAALLFAEHPSATVADVRDKILRSVDKLPSLGGRVASGGRLNLYKAAAESTVARSSSTLTFTAGRGEANDVFVTAFTSPTGVAKYRISDRYSTDPAVRQGGSRVVPGAGCTAAGESVAVCPAAGVARIILNGGDLDDRLRAPALALPVSLNGGGGSDSLIGGAAPDRFAGGIGDDRIRARNLDVDATFSCGENPGDSDLVLADASPADAVTAAADNCERVIAG